MTSQDNHELIAEVTTAFNQLADAAKTLDHEQYLARFDQQQFTALNADGTVLHGFAQFKQMYLEQVVAIEKYESLNFDKIKINMLNATACVLVNEYLAEVTLKSGDTVKAGGAGTQVWCKSSGDWLLTHVSSSMKSA